MKKLFFALVAVTVVALTACNNKPASTENTAPATDTTAVKAAVESTSAADTTKPATTDSMATEKK